MRRARNGTSLFATGMVHHPVGAAARSPKMGFARLHATPLAQDSGSACVTDFDTRRQPDEVRASIVVGRSTAGPVSSTLDPVVLALCGLALAALTPLAMTAIFAPLAATRYRRLGG